MWRNETQMVEWQSGSSVTTHWVITPILPRAFLTATPVTNSEVYFVYVVVTSTYPAREVFRLS